MDCLLAPTKPKVSTQTAVMMVVGSSRVAVFGGIDLRPGSSGLQASNTIRSRLHQVMARMAMCCTVKCGMVIDVVAMAPSVV